MQWKLKPPRVNFLQTSCYKKTVYVEKVTVSDNTTSATKIAPVSGQLYNVGTK